MFLTATNIASYLEDVGLLSARDLADGEVSIVETGRRNRNFRVHRTRRPSLFVKQVPVVMAETRLSFQREAACSQLAAGDALPALGTVMPRLMRYDHRQQVLAFELIEEGRSGADVFGAGGTLDLALIEALAGTLARIHVETAPPGALAPVAEVMPGEAPWIFIIADKAELVMPNMSAAMRDLVALIRRTPELCQGLAALGAGWQGRCLIHGDFKWDNLLVLSEPEGGRTLRIVDWELANLGDPLWDAAGVLGSLLQIWLMGPSPNGGVPVPMMHQAAQRFWSRYHAGVRELLPQDAMLRLARLTGARMVLLAFELLPGLSAITPQAESAIALARYLFQQPERALGDLTGLRAEGASLAPWRIDPAGASR